MKIKSIGANKTELELKDLRLLISYETPVAAIRLNVYPNSIDNTGAAIKTDEFWSVTTSKHVNQWLESHGFKPGEIPTVEQQYFDDLLEDNEK